MPSGSILGESQSQFKVQEFKVQEFKVQEFKKFKDYLLYTFSTDYKLSTINFIP